MDLFSRQEPTRARIIPLLFFFGFQAAVTAKRTVCLSCSRQALTRARVTLSAEMLCTFSFCRASVCIYVYIYIYVCAYMYTHICVYISMIYIYVHMYIVSIYVFKYNFECISQSDDGLLRNSCCEYVFAMSVKYVSKRLCICIFGKKEQG